MSITNKKWQKLFQTLIYFIMKKGAPKVLNFFFFFNENIKLALFLLFGQFYRCVPIKNKKNSHNRKYIEKIMNPQCKPNPCPLVLYHIFLRKILTPLPRPTQQLWLKKSIYVIKYIFKNNVRKHNEKDSL